MAEEIIRVLLVEDDEDDYVLTRNLFEGRSGDRFRLDWVDTYGRALEVIKRKEHDLYLFDYRLGKETGLELLMTAISMGLRAPIILLTAQGDHDLDMAAMEMGASDYLDKSTLTAESLGRSIRYALERKRVEERLRESEETALALLNAPTDSAILFDLEANFLALNEIAAKRLGSSVNELVGRCGYDLLPPDLAESRKKRVLQVTQTKRPVRFQDERAGIIQDVNLYPIFNEQGEVERIASFASDITEKVRMEEALRKSEEKYRTMMESMDDPVYICSPDYRVEYMNRAMVKRAGRDAVGEPCYTALHELDEKCPWCVHEKVQQGENCVTEIDSPRDNHTYVSNFPVHNADGSVSKLTIYRDVTEIRKMEAQFQQATKMEAIATLAGGVAHEFNNALMGVMGNIELLRMDLPEDEKKAKYLERMNESGHRMSHLTDQLLAYAQGGKYQPRDLELNVFVIQTLPILQHSLSPAVRVETHFPTVSYIKADNAQMQMVLSAILANSNEAIEDEGIIRIAAENKDIDEDFTKQHPGLMPGSYVCLTIKDNGKGMEEKTKDRIFEPFFTTKFQGRGMGMAAVYGIVMNHDGLIYVDSELGKGTTVEIYLPAGAKGFINKPVVADDVLQTVGKVFKGVQ